VSRRWVLAVVAYGVLVGSVFTPLYDPFTQGRDQSWLILVVLASAHIGVGIGVARLWVFLLPVGLGVVGFLAAGADGSAWLILFLATPAGVVATALGLAAGHMVKGRGTLLAASAFAIGMVPFAWAAAETVDRSSSPHVSSSVQAELPTEWSLGNLCPGAETPPRITRRIEHQAEVLLRELRLQPDWLVSYTYYYEDAPDERKDITVRELAEEQLSDLKSGGSSCAPQLQRRLREALD
jgi:hypothetical protein